MGVSLPHGRRIAYNAGMPGATPLRELAAETAGGTRGRRLYDEDFWAWTQEQADALRRRDAGAIDWENVIEEVETLGRSDERAWASNCANAIAHLLKIEHYGSVEDLNHWRREVLGYRREMYRKLRGSRGMKGKLPELLQEAWGDGREEAVGKMAEYDADGPAEENRLRRGWDLRVPPECPYSLIDIAGCDPYDKKARPRDDVWPAPVARALNEGLGTDYPVRFLAPDRGGGRSR